MAVPGEVGDPSDSNLAPIPAFSRLYIRCRSE